MVMLTWENFSYKETRGVKWEKIFVVALCIISHLNIQYFL